MSAFEIRRDIASPIEGIISPQLEEATLAWLKNIVHYFDMRLKRMLVLIMTGVTNQHHSDLWQHPACWAKVVLRDSNSVHSSYYSIKQMCGGVGLIL